MYQWSPHMQRKKKLEAINTVEEFESIMSKVLLKPKYKELLRYLYIDDLTLMQAAEKLNIEYATVKTWHGEALAKVSVVL
ncbi:MAG: sigma factor-like helix-turn-helix DNA-binding protein [Anaerovoracaceae bacterium]